MQTGLILGLKHQRTSPMGVTSADSARVPQQRHQGWLCDHPAARNTCMWLVRSSSLSPFIRAQQGFRARSLFVCLCFSSCPAPICRRCCFPKAKRNMGLRAHGTGICPVFDRWENLCLCLSASAAWGTDRPEAAAWRWVLQRGAGGGASRAGALQEAESKGRFQTSPFSCTSAGNCTSHAWMCDSFQLGNWEISRLTSAQELQSRSQEVSRETCFITWTAVL